MEINVYSFLVIFFFCQTTQYVFVRLTTMHLGKSELLFLTNHKLGTELCFLFVKKKPKSFIKHHLFQLQNKIVI